MRLVLLTACVVAVTACDDGGRRRPGSTPGSQRSRDAASNTDGSNDQDVPPGVDLGFGDAGFVDFGPRIDTGFAADLGFPGRDATPRDLGFPDAGFRDSGVRPDAFVFPDVGFFDSGPRPDSGVSGTAVAFVASSAMVEIDNRAGAPADKLNFVADLTYDNPTGQFQVITVTGAGLDLLGMSTVTFDVTPVSHNAPPGASTIRVTKVPGSATSIGIEQILCLFPLPTGVSMTFSNGQTIADSAPVNCLQ